MRLLDKKEVDSIKASERKREVDEGVKLARKVDSLRELHAAEETRLNKYRDDVLAKLRSDTTEATAEFAALKGEIRFLEERRAELMKPVDKLWDDAKKYSDSLSTLKEELNQRSIYLESLERMLDKRNQDNLTEVSRLADERIALLEGINSLEVEEERLSGRVRAFEATEKFFLEGISEREESVQRKLSEALVHKKESEMIRTNALQVEEENRKERIRLVDLARTIERNRKR